MADTATGADCKGIGIELTIYTNSGSSGRDEWLKARAAQDDYSLAIVSDGASAIQERLKGEKANPIVDVVSGLNAIIWNDLVANDVPVPCEAPSWIGQVNPNLNDPNGYYCAIVIRAILLVSDSNQVAPEDAPIDWSDLWENEALWGKYESQIKLTGGTTRNVLVGIFARYADPDGELGVSDEGWAAIEAFLTHGTLVGDGVDLYAQIINPDPPC